MTPSDCPNITEVETYGDRAFDDTVEVPTIAPQTEYEYKQRATPHADRTKLVRRVNRLVRDTISAVDNAFAVLEEDIQEAEHGKTLLKSDAQRLIDRLK